MNDRGSVLIVDDEESILLMLEQFLSKEKHFHVETADTGEKALKLLEKSDFNVALIDLKLPDINGLEFVNIACKTSPGMKCVIMTAFASLESTIEALRMNVFDYLVKPFDLVKVGESVEAAFNHTVMKRENASIVQRLEVANRKLEESKRVLNSQVLKANDNLAQANEALNKHVTRLKMLFQMGRDISSNENWGDALDRFLMALCRYIEADGTALLLFSNVGGDLKVRTSYHIDEEWLNRSVELLIQSQREDLLPTEIFNIESSAEGRTKMCLEMTTGWRYTAVPLLYKGRWLGFLIIEKHYRSKLMYLPDYHFINTIQTILTEEVANAVAISRLRSLKNFNETILENINNGVLTTDRTGKIIFTNKRAKEILGDNIDGRGHFDELFQNPFGRGGLFEFLIRNRDRSCSVKGSLSLQEGRTIPIRLNTTRIETDEYHGQTIVAVFEDLTEQKEMEEELRRADRLRSLGELSAGVAHEIRNPLTGIATTAQVLKEKLGGEIDKIKYIAVILDEINRLDDIIRNLLSFARPSMPNPVELSLDSLFSEAVPLLSDESSARGVTIIVKNELDDDHCLLDRDQMKQVILNITLNGIQACSGGGKVNIYLRPAEDPSFIKVEFTDTGRGIPEEAADRLYNPFFTTRPEGTGLGLSISRKIIEGHGGRIYHRSHTSGGTSFYVDIPRRTMVSAAGKKTAEVT